MVKEKIDNFMFEDNIRRFFLYDLLRRKKCLKGITLNDLDWLVNDINTLISNLNSDLKEGKKLIKISDKDNQEGGSLFRKIILHNTLDIPIKYEGSEKEFKGMLENRWGEKIKKEVIKALK